MSMEAFTHIGSLILAQYSLAANVSGEAGMLYGIMIAAVCIPILIITARKR